MTSKITVALAIITNERNEILALRKNNSVYYTLPGGKFEFQETPIDALIRELSEELHLRFEPTALTLVGTHITQAANEPDTIVEGHIFRLNSPLNIKVSTYAEIVEHVWLSHANYKDYNLAHLLKEFALPLWLAQSF